MSVFAVWHVDDIHFRDMPTPRRWHRCSAHTMAIMDSGMTVERCTCGAMQLNGHGWSGRNSRRKYAAKQRARTPAERG